MLWLLLLVVGFVSTANGYLNRLYTKEDESKLVNLIIDSQSENHKSKWFFENSLSSTFYATDGLSLLNHDIPNSQHLCQTLQSYKPSNWEEFHHLLMTRSKMNECLKSITDKTQSKLVNGLTSNKLSQVYYAVDAVNALNKLGLFDTSSLDIGRLLSHIATFQTSKDHLFAETSKSTSSSVYRSSLALIATVKVLSMSEPEYLILHGQEIGKTLEKFVLAAKNLFGKYDSNGEFLSYANSLTATSFVVESLDAFIVQLKYLQQLKKDESNDSSHFDNLLQDFDDPFNDSQYVEKLTRYILSYTGNTNVVTSRHIIRLMRIIGNSVAFSQSQPMTIMFSNNVFTSDGKNLESGKEFTVHISNVFDESILTNDDMNNVVKLISSKEFSSKKEGPNGNFLVVSGSNNKDFTYDFGTNLIKYIGTNDASDSVSFGMFNLKIEIYDNKLFGDNGLTIRSDVKVLTKITGVQFGAALAKDVEKGGYQRVKYPSGKIKDILEISPSQKAKFEISVKCQQRPSFIAVQFVDSQDNVVTQVIPRRRQEKYSLSIDISKKTYNALKEGRYSVNLVLSDALYENGGIVWKNIVSFDAFEEEEEMVEKDYEPINDETPLWKAKHEIEHTFGESQEQISGIITLIFTLIVWIPLIWLIFVYLFQQKLSFSCQDVSVPLAILFLFSLVSVSLVLAIYWLNTNIFQATGYLVSVSVPLYFIMYRILKNKLTQRTAKKNKSE